MRNYTELARVDLDSIEAARVEILPLCEELADVAGNRLESGHDFHHSHTVLVELHARIGAIIAEGSAALT